MERKSNDAAVMHVQMKLSKEEITKPLCNRHGTKFHGDNAVKREKPSQDRGSESEDNGELVKVHECNSLTIRSLTSVRLIRYYTTRSF
jgi:hypothetical protein